MLTVTPLRLDSPGSNERMPFTSSNCPRTREPRKGIEKPTREWDDSMRNSRAVGGAAASTVGASTIQVVLRVTIAVAINVTSPKAGIEGRTPGRLALSERQRVPPDVRPARITRPARHPACASACLPAHRNESHREKPPASGAAARFLPGRDHPLPLVSRPPRRSRPPPRRELFDELGRHVVRPRRQEDRIEGRRLGPPEVAVTVAYLDSAKSKSP